MDFELVVLWLLALAVIVSMLSYGELLDFFITVDR